MWLGRLFLMLALLSITSVTESFAAIAIVGANTADTSPNCDTADSCSKAYPQNVVAGNLLVVGGTVWDDPAPTPIVVTDTQSNTWNVVECTPLDTGRNTPFMAWTVAGSSAANTVTVNPNGSSANYTRFTIAEFSGTDATSPLSVNGGSSTGTSTAPADTIVTLTNNELILAHEGHFNGNITITDPSGYTRIGANQGTNRSYDFTYKILATAGSDTPTFGLSASQPWVACTLSFREPTGGARRGQHRLQFLNSGF